MKVLIVEQYFRSTSTKKRSQNRFLTTNNQTRRATASIVYAKKNKNRKVEKQKPDDEAAAPRVMTNLRQTLSIIKEEKKQLSTPSKPLKRSSYRRDREKVQLRAEEELESQKQREKEEPKTPSTSLESQSLALRNLYGSKGQLKPNVLLVDGYNFLNAWRRTKPLLAPGPDSDLDTARRMLISALGGYSAWAGVEVVVAFDAMGGWSKITNRETNALGVDVVYCGDMEADTFLVQEARRQKDTGAPWVSCATRDGILITSLLTHGVWWTSLELLAREIDRTDKALDDFLRNQRDADLHTSLGRIIANQANGKELLVKLGYGDSLDYDPEEELLKQRLRWRHQPLYLQKLESHRSRNGSG